MGKKFKDNKQTVSFYVSQTPSDDQDEKAKINEIIEQLRRLSSDSELPLLTKKIMRPPSISQVKNKCKNFQVKTTCNKILNGTDDDTSNFLHLIKLLKKQLNLKHKEIYRLNSLLHESNAKNTKSHGNQSKNSIVVPPWFQSYLDSICEERVQCELAMSQLAIELEKKTNQLIETQALLQEKTCGSLNYSQVKPEFKLRNKFSQFLQGMIQVYRVKWITLENSCSQIADIGFQIAHHSKRSNIHLCVWDEHQILNENPYIISATLTSVNMKPNLKKNEIAPADSLVSTVQIDILIGTEKAQQFSSFEAVFHSSDQCNEFKQTFKFLQECLANMWSSKNQTCTITKNQENSASTFLDLNDSLSVVQSLQKSNFSSNNLLQIHSLSSKLTASNQLETEMDIDKKTLGIATATTTTETSNPFIVSDKQSINNEKNDYSLSRNNDLSQLLQCVQHRVTSKYQHQYNSLSSPCFTDFNECNHHETLPLAQLEEELHQQLWSSSSSCHQSSPNTSDCDKSKSASSKYANSRSSCNGNRGGKSDNRSDTSRSGRSDTSRSGRSDDSQNSKNSSSNFSNTFNFSLCTPNKSVLDSNSSSLEEKPSDLISSQNVEVKCSVRKDDEEIKLQQRQIVMNALRDLSAFYSPVQR